MASPKVLKIGTRGSALALAQTQQVIAQLKNLHPELIIQIVTIKTSGDQFKGKLLAEAGGKGLFVKEIEEALLKGEIDLAIHSLKDLPGQLPKDLTLACFPKREDPRDCFLSPKYKKFEDLPAGAVIGTGSIRRRLQILAKRPDLKCEPIRGNVDTRLRKLGDENYDALILAAAGLKRLQRETVICEYFEPEFFIPAVGQGILAIEIHKSNEVLADFLKQALADEPTAVAARAERIFLQTIGGDCFTPMGGYATVAKQSVRLLGWLASPDGTKQVRRNQSGPIDNPEKLGQELAGGILDAIASHQSA